MQKTLTQEDIINIIKIVENSNFPGANAEYIVQLKGKLKEMIEAKPEE